jgi:hypothetical protein
MLVDAAGAAYLSGSTLVDMGVVKVNALGGTAWVHLLPGGTSAGMVLGSANQIYLAGGIYTARINLTPLEEVFANGFE